MIAGEKKNNWLIAGNKGCWLIDCSNEIALPVFVWAPCLRNPAYHPESILPSEKALLQLMIPNGENLRDYNHGPM